MENSMSKLTAKGRSGIADRQFAFSAQRKEPLENASHVRNAVARFNQVQGVTDRERDVAWQRILDAAKRHDVDVKESNWRDLAADRTATHG
jgi:hypothetical protein